MSMKLAHRHLSRKFKSQPTFCKLITRICNSNPEIRNSLFSNVLWKNLNAWASSGTEYNITHIVIES